MNAEHKHQLYGGDIGDYMTPQKYAPAMDAGIDDHTSNDLAQIYNSQIKGKPSIDTSGLINTNITPPITRDPHYDKIEADLTNTLNMISQQLDLTNNAHTAKTKATTLLPQGNDDISAAQQNVLNALKELKDLNAI